MPQSSLASTYIEAGTGFATFTKAGNYFGTSSADTASGGFAGSLSVYFPVTRTQNWVRLQLGLQNRLNMGSIKSTGQSLVMGSSHVGLRVEVWRLYFGAGYAPWMLTSDPGTGVSGLKTRPQGSGYLGEAGILWRVIPEFQIALGASLEFGTVPGGSSPNPITEFGLRFRFPFKPKEGGGRGSVDFDGFRYPFGFMK